jgi:hypothetical protein
VACAARPPQMRAAQFSGAATRESADFVGGMVYDDETKSSVISERWQNEVTQGRRVARSVFAC